MNSPYGKIVLVTGASSGIGAATARLLAENGYTVYGACRREMTDVTTQNGEIRYVKMDVTDDASVKNAVSAIVAQAGEIDVVVNCAGNGIAGALEDCTVAEAEYQFSANYFGVIRVLNSVLPVMRSQKRGLVVNIGSIAGLYAIPFQSLYSSSKFAIEALTEALRMELYPFGVKASVVEPGDTKTGFTGARKFCAASAGSAYEETMRRSVAKMEHDEQNGVSPVAVAKCVLLTMQKKNPPVRTVVGFSYRCLVFLRRILPARTINWLLRILYC